MTAQNDFLSAPYPTIPSGTKIGNRYLIQAILGQGGLGRTYLAFDSHRFNEPCVLKEFAPAIASVDLIEKSQTLFEREAQILYQLKHPQIPQFYASFTAENRLFLVQQYVRGQSYYQLLEQRLRSRKTFSEAEILDLLFDLLPVLQYIHDRGIVHRDISPDNIMQLYDKQLPILIDFGVGKQAVGLRSQQTVDALERKTFVGKIGYAPQEQMSLGICYPCSDLYSLAVTTIVLLTGRQPNTLLNLYSLEWEWRAYTNVSNSFARILDKLLNRNPKQRYQSATEVIVALKQISNSSYPTGDRYSELQKRDSNPQERQNNARKVSSTDRSEVRTDFTPETTSETLVLNSKVERSSFVPSEEIIESYQKQLAYYIGPIAHLIVREILASNSIDSYSEFREALINYIPDVKQKLEFKQKVV